VQVPSHLELPAELERLDELREHVSTCAAEQGVSRETVADIELAVAEVFVNIANYACGSGMVQVSCRSDENRFLIEIADDGIPFDLLSAPPPNLSSEIGERKAGGLGVFLVKELMDEVQYCRTNDRNVVTLTVFRNWSEDSA